MRRAAGCERRGGRGWSRWTRPEREEDYTPFLIADWREIPSQALERDELARQIERAIENLPPTYREVFLLRDKEEMSIEEIAQASA